MILIAAHDDDPTGIAVARCLEAEGAPVRRLDASRLWSDVVFSIDPLSERFGEGRIFATCREGFESPPAEGETFSTIYWRRPLDSSHKLRMAFPCAEELAGMESFSALRLAVEALPRSFFPLGHPVPMERSANKLLQLHLAHRMGFAVPATVTGNDPEPLREFLSRHEFVVVKPVQAYATFHKDDRARIDQLLWTRGIDRDALLQRLDPKKPSQLMLQEMVIKKRDWRITVLPHRTICCEIDTSSLPADQPDWRKRAKRLPHAIVEVPEDFDRSLRRYLAELDLTAGYFDFAVKNDGTPVFLEVNTNAQWLWIEELTGFPISKEIAKCLRESGG